MTTTHTQSLYFSTRSSHTHTQTHTSLHSSTLFHLTNHSQLAPARGTHNLSKLFNNVINHFALTSHCHRWLYKWSQSGLRFKGAPSYNGAPKSLELIGLSFCATWYYICLTQTQLAVKRGPRSRNSIFLISALKVDLE